MELNASNLPQKKQAILEILKNQGPCLPAVMASKIGLQLMMASVVLSDLKAEQAVKISSLKVGGSPLYYLEGQEAMLENFIKHLPGKEREAFEILKKQGVLDEAPLEPAHRVALRNMKDFAFPLVLKTENGDRIFWHFHAVNEGDAKLRIEEMINKEAKDVKKEKPVEKAKAKEEKVEKKTEAVNVKEDITPAENKKPESEKGKEGIGNVVSNIDKPEKPKAKPRKKATHRKDFAEKVLEHINKKEMQIIRNFDDDGNKICIAQLDSKVGMLKFLVFGLNKKALSESDLGLAFSEGQHERLPVLLVTSGKMTKKAEEYLKKLGDYVVVNKI